MACEAQCAFTDRFAVIVLTHRAFSNFAPFAFLAFRGIIFDEMFEFEKTLGPQAPVTSSNGNIDAHFA
jgi:hypothetical protein